MKISLPKTTRPAHRSQPKPEVINGFEVWKQGGEWHALKWPRSMTANTKKAIVKMIGEG
jgi:hypothetical protein